MSPARGWLQRLALKALEMLRGLLGPKQEKARQLLHHIRSGGQGLEMCSMDRDWQQRIGCGQRSGAEITS